MEIILGIAAFVGVIYLAMYLYAKALNDKGAVGDIANIIHWLLRHWYVLIVIVIAIAFVFGFLGL